MAVYFVIFVVLVVCAIIDKKSKNDFFKIFFFVLLTLFAGFRHNVGVDYVGYEQTFDEVVGFVIREPGGAWIMNMVRKIGGTVQLYLLLMALITQFFVYKTFIRNKQWFWTSTYVYYSISLFYLASFNGVRQYAAMAVSIWSLYLMRDNKKYYYFLVIFLAAFFLHSSVILFLPLYFFIRKSFPLWIHFVILMIAGVVSKFISVIASYASFDIYNIVERDITVGITQYLFAIFSFMLLILGRKMKSFYSNTILYNMNSLCVSTLLIVIMQTSGMFIMICQRINNYFLFSFLLIIPCILNSISKENRVGYHLFFALFCFSYFIRTIVFEGQRYQLVPYNINYALLNF